jgi:oxygen-independent coproporphyrinogen-3 oxidase
MDPRLLRYAEQNVPRYTSYPAAPHFNASVDAGVCSGWLGELSPDASVSLYLHIPYCQQMCWYCGCHAFAAKRDEPVADFVDALLAEIDLVAAATTARRVNEIHWGGGTPNILSPARFDAIVKHLSGRFDLSVVQRHAVEIDPRVFTEAHAQMYARWGVNRASLGVQDLDARVQAGIGREQEFEVVARAVAALGDAGIGALSLDLMYGLPHQTLESVRRTVGLAASLRPQRFSVFGYAHVPWFKSRQRLMDESALPAAAARFELADAIRDQLAQAGYVAIGYDHYALPYDPIAVAARDGALSRNFQGFVEAQADALIGLGPSSISTFPQGYAQSEPEVGKWRQAVTAGGLATKRGIALSDEDRRRRDLIMTLLCAFEVDLARFGGRGRYTDALEGLRPLASDGLVAIEGDCVRVPADKRPFARLVAHAFDTYSRGDAARHSRAV